MKIVIKKREERKRVSYADYMFFHYAIAGMLGLFAVCLACFSSRSSHIFGLICEAGSSFLIISGHFRNVDKPDEMSEMIVNESRTVGMISVAVVACVLLVIEAGTILDNISIMVNLFDVVPNTIMMVVFWYCMVTGFAYKFIESRD